MSRAKPPSAKLHYKSGVLGFLAEMRVPIGFGLGLLVFAATVQPETSTGEVGFLGILLWMPALVAGMTAYYCMSMLKTLGTLPQQHDGDKLPE